MQTHPEKAGLLTLLVTGASRGIGLEMVRQYAGDESWRVHACCRAPGKAGELARLAAGAGGRVQVHALDVSDGDRIAALARELSGESIDILLNNAAIYGARDAGAGTRTIDERGWLEVFKVNTIAPLAMAEAFLPHVERSRRKVIACISSLMGSVSDNRSGGYHQYRSSKAALNMIVKNLAIDLGGRGVTVVALSPGWVRTDMGGPSAPLSPEQSVRGLRRVLDALTPAASGTFIGHDGAVLPW